MMSISLQQKIFLIIISIVIVVSGTYFFLPHTSLAPGDTILVTLGTTTIDALLADDETERIQGLSGRDDLGQREGMLFVFDVPDLWGIWMKDMKFPIDIVWIDENLKIVNIENKIGTETFPKVFFPTVPALYVLEIPSSTALSAGVSVHDRISLSKKF